MLTTSRTRYALDAEFDATGQPCKWWARSPISTRSRSSAGASSISTTGTRSSPAAVHLQGRQVLGEALGDLAGVRLAYRALQRSMQRHPVPVIDGLSPEHQFFIAWGQYRVAAESKELQRQMVKGDPHPTARYRVIGPLSNAPQFQQAFVCKAGSAKVRPPEQRCVVW